MQKSVVAKIDESFLECGTEFSDRFVYSNSFVPFSVTFDDNKTPILPTYKKYLLREFITTYPWVNPLDIVSHLPDQGLDNLLKKNKFTLSPIKPDPLWDPVRNPVERVGGRSRVEPPLKEKIVPIVNDMKDLVEIISGRINESDRGYLSVMNRKIDEINTSVTASMMVSSSTEGSVVMPAPDYLRPLLEALGVLENQEIEFFLNLLRSDVGYVFLDRTRIRPKGFAIGEHLYSLSLAPGEEIVMEQKTFSKRQITFEEQNEQEQQFDLELSSTLSTEIQEGFERQKNRTDSWGLTWNFGVQYASPQTDYGQVNANFNIGETRNVTEANQETRTRSVKDSQTASSKVASKYRTLHKTTFKISTEEGFESTSKRVIKNPNRFSPINLHYFKILQALEMSQERYGVRLCWAPCVKDPAFAFFQQINKGKEEILTKARTTLPQKPVEPQPLPPSGGQANTQVEKKMFYSAITPADKWGISGDMSADYDIDIPYESGYGWDGDLEVIKASLNLITRRTEVGALIKGIPIPMSNADGTFLRVKVHVGAGVWIGGPGIEIQVGAQFIKAQMVTDKTNEDTKYKDDLAAYRTKLKEWEDNTARLMTEAQEQADAWEKEMLRNVNPLTEMINRIIQQLFPPAFRDECWEIDLWQKLFDWERASYTVYPSWWSDLLMRDPTKESTHFFNASWAKLYLPVRVGMERLALRWIFGKTVENKLEAEIENQFDEIEKDIKKYRKTMFGSSSEIIELDKECKDFEEKFDCIAKWQDLMPTDGTHLEVIQSITSAADQFSKNEADDANELRNAMVEGQKQDIELKKKAIGQMTSAAKTDVHITTDGGSSGG